MAKTSVHLKPCNIPASEAHNKREKELDYVKTELSHLNESFSFIDHTLQAELAQIKREVKEKTGRKLQKNAIPIKEGVVVIDNRTTMEDLRRYCGICRDKFGIQPLQIHIHRDEGHSGAKEWKPNLHAHIVWRMYNDDGRNVRLSSDNCSEMQTILAEILGMERGKPSNKKHLSSLQFKIEQLKNQLEEQSRELEETRKECTRLKGAYEGAKQGVSDIFTGKSKRKIKEAEKKRQEALQALSEEKDKIRLAEEALRALKAKYANTKADLDKALGVIEEAVTAIKQSKKKEENLKKAESFIEDSATMGLTARQMMDVKMGKQVALDTVSIEAGEISRTDGKPILVRMKEGILEVLNTVQWQNVFNWCRGVLYSSWYSINGVPNDRRTQSRGIKF